MHVNLTWKAKGMISIFGPEVTFLGYVTVTTNLTLSSSDYKPHIHFCETGRFHDLNHIHLLCIS
jgi:hypothetical protein